MATSGTVGTTVFNTRKVIDRIYGRCKINPTEITSERIQIALDYLFLRLSSMANKGIPTWTIERQVLPLYQGVWSIPTPVGTVDVLSCNLRRLQRLTGTASASAGDAEFAFDGDLSTACAAGVDGFIQIQFDSATRAVVFGILPDSSGTWSFELQGSDDGISFTTFYEAEDLAVGAGEWEWIDVEGMEEWIYLRLQATDGTDLDVTEFVTANMPNEIPLALTSLDDYANLPDKSFLSQPTQFWYDKRRVQPLLVIWPAPRLEYTFANLVCYFHRQIQDVGTLAQEIEVPQRWYLALIARVSGDVAMEEKDVPPDLVVTLSSVADREWDAAWDSESDGSSASLVPGIGVYTR